MNLCVLFFFLEKNVNPRVNRRNCINVNIVGDMVYCTGENCDKLIGICNDLDGEEVITLMNVREIVSVPHTSYSRHVTGRGVQCVQFNERLEFGEERSSKVLKFPDFMIYPLEIRGSGSDTPSTSNSGEIPTIRVAAFATEALMHVNENEVLNHFTNALKQTIVSGSKYDVMEDAAPMEVCSLERILAEPLLTHGYFGGADDDEEDCDDFQLNLLE